MIRVQFSGRLAISAGGRSDPLHDMANFVLDGLGYLFAGGASGPMPISLPAGSPAKRRGTRTPALLAPGLGHGEQPLQTAAGITRPCGCPADPTPEGLFASLSYDSIFDHDEEILEWTQHQPDSQTSEAAQKREPQPQMLTHSFRSEGKRAPDSFLPAAR